MIKMSETKPTIGISLRIVSASGYNEKRDALSQDWTKFFEKLEVNPLLIPNTLKDISSFLDDMKVQGLILSGGDSINDDIDRDETEEKILNYSIKKKIPLVGVCRGMQAINKFFGGEVETLENSEHVGNTHPVSLNKKFLSLLQTKNLQVNSFHHNIIKQKNLGQNLEAFAIANDNTVEGFYHSELPIVGVMWHPERTQNHENKLLIRNVFFHKN